MSTQGCLGSSASSLTLRGSPSGLDLSTYHRRYITREWESANVSPSLTTRQTRRNHGPRSVVTSLRHHRTAAAYRCARAAAHGLAMLPLVLGAAPTPALRTGGAVALSLGASRAKR
eukprot:6147096-Prymnesium_polylepis.1